MQTLVHDLISDVDREDAFENVAMDVIDEMAFNDAERAKVPGSLFWSELILFFKEMISQCLENRLKRAARLAGTNNRRYAKLCGRLEKAFERNEHLEPFAQSAAGGVMTIFMAFKDADWAELKG